MPISLVVSFDSRELAAFSSKRLKRAFEAAMAKAGATGLRDMKSEASKRVRARKRLKAGYIAKQLVLRRPSRNQLDGGEWAIDVRGTATPASMYPHRQTKKGVVIEINKGSRVLVKHAFMATLTRGGKGGGGAGHSGIFIRKGASRLPIMALIGSRPVDALLFGHEAEAVQQRGASSMAATFTRLLPLELEKVKGGQ